MKASEGKIFWKVLLGLSLCLGALAGGGYLLLGRPMASRAILRTEPSTGMVLYEVPKHVSIAALARDLHAKGLIAFPRVFRAFVHFTHQDKRIRAGFYYLPPRNSVMEMAFKLTSGKMATQTVAIPEGKASWEIYEILADVFPLDSAVFDSLVHSAAFVQSLGLEGPSLEGYLFPDTYVLPFRISESDMLRCMVQRFQEERAQMPPNSEVVKRYGLHGWVTLASIVEREAAVIGEQKLIAGVFWNRLRLGWALGADPTVRFITRKWTGSITYADLRANSPYNTRRFAGLPPGPICNPGRGALMAALLPEETRMMFFVAKDDGSREHFFSATNPEHDRFKRVAAENRRNRMELLVSQEAALAEKHSPAAETPVPRQP